QVFLHLCRRKLAAAIVQNSTHFDSSPSCHRAAETRLDLCVFPQPCFFISCCIPLKKRRWLLLHFHLLQWPKPPAIAPGVHHRRQTHALRWFHTFFARSKSFRAGLFQC